MNPFTPEISIATVKRILQQQSELCVKSLPILSLVFPSGFPLEIFFFFFVILNRASFRVYCKLFNQPADLPLTSSTLSRPTH